MDILIIPFRNLLIININKNRNYFELIITDKKQRAQLLEKLKSEIVSEGCILSFYNINLDALDMTH